MRAWAAALLLAPAVVLAGGAPLDEIRQAFVRHGLHAPDGAALEGLGASGLAEGLRRTLASVARQSVLPDQIVVVDGSDSQVASVGSGNVRL